MAERIVNDGLNFIENVIVDSNFLPTLDTVALGTGTESPSSTDSSLTNNIYERSTSNTNVTASTTNNTGELRFTIEVTGGTEVPADSELTEFAIKGSDGTLVYYEVRSGAIDVASGETKIIELKLRPTDAGTSSVAITNDGANLVADMLIGNTSEVLDTIAVGSSQNNTSLTDSSMFDEVYRASSSQSIVDISTTSNVGQPVFLITLSAGSESDDEVSGGTDISEFGIISSDSNTLYLHETRNNTVTLDASDSKTFNIPSNIVQ